ncbi:MAG: aminoglycoside phosphotransferase family protein [Rickettsiales bacterium]
MTFKTNWEKSESRHQLPAGIIKKMINYACPGKQLKSSQIIAGGCANLNVKIQLENEESPLILRIHLRDKKSAILERNIGNLLKNDLPAPQILYIGNIDNYCFSISQFMPGIPLRDLLLSKTPYNLEEIMYEVGRYLSKIAAHKFSKTGFFDENLEIIEELGGDSLKEFSLSCLEHQQVQKYLGHEMIIKIKSLLNSLPPLETKDANLVHADFDPANILVAEVDGKWKISAILDWEFAYSGSWLNDVANMLRYAHKMPDGFKNSFLKGLKDNGLKLPKNWQSITNQYTCSSLLDSMTRHNLETLPNIREDLCDLINHVISSK